MSCAWSLTGLGSPEQAYPMHGASHGLFTDSANVFLTASAVGIELPILSVGSGSANHLTNRASPTQVAYMQLEFLPTSQNLVFILESPGESWSSPGKSSPGDCEYGPGDCW